MGGTNGLFHTSEHHHVLEVSFDLVPSAEVEEEGERVDVERSSDEDGDLTGASRGLRRGPKGAELQRGGTSHVWVLILILNRDLCLSRDESGDSWFVVLTERIRTPPG